jgi:hypothetical protein
MSTSTDTILPAPASLLNNLSADHLAFRPALLHAVLSGGCLSRHAAPFLQREPVKPVRTTLVFRITTTRPSTRLIALSVCKAAVSSLAHPETMTAAALSPDGSPEPPAHNVAQKRKLASLSDTTLANGVSSANSPHEALPPQQTCSRNIEGLLRNILTILQWYVVYKCHFSRLLIKDMSDSHDTTPSILEYPLDDIDSNAPSAKRQKLANDAAPRTIASALSQGNYESLEAVVDQVDQICQKIIQPIKEREAAILSGPHGRHGQLEPHDKELWSAVVAFQTVLGELVRGEERKQKDVEKATSNDDGAEAEAKDGAVQTDEPGAEEADIFNSGHTVLSIFANAQGPKQLFSSFQRPDRVGESDATSVEVTLPLRESALPNFITTTKVPARLVSSDSKSVKKTFSDRFGPPRHIPRLHPPEPSSKLATKSNVITWIPYETLAKQANRRSYNYGSAPQPSGAWITYKNAHVPGEASSPEEKRRQRDRALSTGAAQPPQSEATRIATEIAKEDALFRSAFSSFAPCRDNSGATVSDEVRGHLWWSKVGRFRAAQILVDPDIQEHKAEQYLETRLEEEDRAFREAAETFDETTLEDLSLPDEKADEDKDTDGLLQDINDLIETLYSYQRMRNSTVPSNSAPMTPVGQRNDVADMIGTPSEPTSTEVEVYKTLKQQLALLILQLPPHAVARLNGDRLEELNVSTNIMIETSDDRGVLEEDVPRPVTSHAGQHMTPRAPGSAYGNQQGNHYRLGARQGSGYYPQQIQARTPASMPRQASGMPPYPAGYPSAAGRPGYSQAGYGMPGFNQSPGRVSYPASPAYMGQPAPAAGKVGYGSYQGTPQAAPSRNYLPQATPYGRTPVQPGSYGYQPPPQMQPAAAAPAAGGGSPPMLATPHGRMPAGVAGAVPNGGNGNGGRFGPVQAAAIGPMGFHTSMTTQQQQDIIDRQRAHLAMQAEQARMRAPVTPQQQVNGTAGEE